MGDGANDLAMLNEAGLGVAFRAKPAVAAAAHDRQVALVGRSLWRMNEAARENGYLKDIPDFLDEQQAGFIPRGNLVLICTEARIVKVFEITGLSQVFQIHPSLSAAVAG